MSDTVKQIVMASPSVADLTAQIAAQKDKIRELKEAKSPLDVVRPEVEKYMAMQKALTILSASAPPSLADEQIKKYQEQMAKGGFKAAKPAAGAPKLADEQIQAYHLDQLAKLEKNFKAKKAALTTLKTEVSTITHRAAVLASKWTGGTAPAPVAATIATPAGKLGAVCVAESDEILLALSDYMKTELQIEVIVNKAAKVSSYTSTHGTVEGTHAVLASIAQQSGQGPAERAKVVELCASDMLKKADPTCMMGAKEMESKGEAMNRVNAQITFLNAELKTRVFLAGMTMTIADLMYWAVLRSTMQGKAGAERQDCPNVSRWFNFVQHQKGITSNPMFFASNRMVLY